MTDIQGLLGDEADSLLTYESKGIPKDDLTSPGPTSSTGSSAGSDRSPAGAAQPAGAVRPRPAGRHRATCRSCPVDQGIEHSAAASFAPNPAYFDPENIVELAIEGGCNAVASTFGVLGAVVARSTPTRSRSS